MSTYNKQFQLTLKDVDLIERAVRHQISHLARSETCLQNEESIAAHDKIVELMTVLGNLHNQKIWYGQIHRTGVPLG